MARLTKAEAKLHKEAIDRLSKPSLTEEDKEFIRDHWQESAEHVNSAAGAFFTPYSQALDFALELPLNGSVRILDLCAGIGNLSAAAWERSTYARRDGLTTMEIVCVELNPSYVAVGKKLLPEARWVTGSIFELPADLGHFDVVISNPPFGKVERGGGSAPRYAGAEFEFHVIDIAADYGEYGAFILPSQSAPFKYSGNPRGYEWAPQPKYDRFVKQTGLKLDAGLGVDTTVYIHDWHAVKVQTEHCIADFDEWRRERDVPASVPAVAATPKREVARRVEPNADSWEAVFQSIGA